MLIALLMLVSVCNLSSFPATAVTQLEETDIQETVSSSAYISDTFTSEVLSGSTENLINAILDSDIIISFLVCNSREETGYQTLIGRNPALQELERREDATEILAEMIVQSASRINSGTATLKDMGVAMLLLEPVYAEALTENQIADIASAAELQTAMTDVSTRSTQDSLWDSIVNWFTLTFGGYVGETVSTLSGLDVSARIYAEDFTNSTKESCQAEILMRFPELTANALPCAYYNCHSYAWHSQSTSNGYWINEMNAYLNDPHCIEKTTPAAGYLCVYLDSTNKPVHSAVVVSVSGGEVVCRSKWGSMGLYTHAQDYVPEEYQLDSGGVRCRYYFYNHAYGSAVTSITNAGHYQQCTHCTYTQLFVHSCTITFNSSTHTRTCRTCGWSQTEAHTINSGTGRCTVCLYSGPSSWDSLPGGETPACCNHG